MKDDYPATQKAFAIRKLQKKIYAIEREIVRHSQHGYNQEHGAKWFDEMADMCTERNDLKKMLKKLFTAI